MSELKIPTNNDLFQRARGLFVNEKYNESLQILKDLRIVHPENVTLYPMMAFCARQAGKDEEMRNYLWEIFKTKLIFSKEDIKILTTEQWQSIVRQLNKLKSNQDILIAVRIKCFNHEFEEAEDIINNLSKLEIIEESFWFHYLTGNINFSKNQYLLAINDYTKAIELDTSNTSAYFNRGNSRKALKDYTGSIEDYTKAIELYPSFESAYFNCGISRSALKDFAGAIEDYTRAIELNPSYAIAYNNRGNLRKALKDYTGSIEDYTKAIDLNPSFAIAYGNCGISRSALKDFAGAIEDYTKSIDLNPSDANSYNNRGNSRKALKDYTGSIEDYTRAIELNPLNEKAYNGRGNSRAALKDDLGAVDDFTKAIAINPSYAIAYNNRGISRNSLKYYSEAIEDFNKTIELDSSCFTAYNSRLLAEKWIKLKTLKINIPSIIEYLQASNLTRNKFDFIFKKVIDEKLCAQIALGATEIILDLCNEQSQAAIKAAKDFSIGKIGIDDLKKARDEAYCLNGNPFPEWSEEFAARGAYYASEMICLANSLEDGTDEFDDVNEAMESTIDNIIQATTAKSGAVEGFIDENAYLFEFDEHPTYLTHDEQYSNALIDEQYFDSFDNADDLEEAYQNNEVQEFYDAEDEHTKHRNLVRSMASDAYHQMHPTKNYRTLISNYLMKYFQE